MTDRDHFAAAALTGLIAVMRDESIGEICESAYGWADAMLRERGNQSEPPNSSPVTEPMPKEKRAEVSDGSEPVAWAIERADGGSLMGFCHTKREAARFAHAIIEATKSEHYALRTVPLYSHPQPTLTDAEREAVDTAEASLMRESTDRHTPLPVRQRLGSAAATLRGLLERMK